MRHINTTRCRLTGYVTTIALSVLLLTGCSSTGSTADETDAISNADSNTPQVPSVDEIQAELDSIYALGFNWTYSSQLSFCPDISSYFPTFQFESSDNLLINSWVRRDGNLVDFSTCAPLNTDFQRVYIGGVNATDPLDRNEITLLIIASAASHYGISEEAIAVSNLSVTADTVSWTTNLIAFGLTMAETTTLIRGEQL